MDELLTKYFLDYEGLATYDELIKKYIQEQSASNDTVVNLISSMAQLAEAHEDLEEKHNALEEKVEILNSDVETEGSVKNIVQKAVNDVIDGAPEALDTLKEIADWIDNDETGSAELVRRVSENENNIAELKEQNENLKEYVDTQDKALYDAYQPIQKLKVISLFPVKQGAEQSVASAINALEENSALILNANQNITEDIIIDKSCYIDAAGSTFSGNVSIPASVDVIIENANFEKPVIVA